MPVSPLPFSRFPRDNDALAGRGGLAGGSSAPVTRIGPAATGDASEAVQVGRFDTPAVLADERNGALPVLNAVRQRAEQLGGDLEQLANAGTSAAQVKKLVGRLRDVAVVALDRALQPSQRAALQQQVDLDLGEIDTIASGTLVDGSLLRGRARTPQRTGATASQQTPFRAIGTAALGLTEVAVRSPDQALAAAGAVELAGSRLERAAESVSRAVVRIAADLDELTSPPVTATGEHSLGNTTSAFGSAVELRSDLISNPGTAMRAQSGLEVSRVIQLLDSSQV